MSLAARQLTIFLLVCLAGAVAGGCRRGGGAAESGADKYDTVAFEPRFAQGFEVRSSSADTSARLLVTRSPWQGAGDVETALELSGSPAERIVAMSSSHVAMLDVLGVADRIVGVSGAGFISTPAVRNRIGDIVDVGYDGNVDYEAIVGLRPDIVLLYGVNGGSSMEGKLKELRIPYVYIGDYMEQSPLGKAEWLRFVGEIVGKPERADSLMCAISDRYRQLAELAATAGNRPAVMLNMPTADAWYLPAPDGYMPCLIRDAGGSYPYTENSDLTSVPVDFETAYRLLAGADFWLNTGQATDAAQLASLAPKLAGVGPARTGRVYNNNARLNATGGNDFWESSAVNPDRVLADIIAIIHPELLPDHELYYYRHLK